MEGPLRPDGRKRLVDNYALRLLIVVGVVVLGFITAVGILSLVMVIDSIVRDGVRWTGDFWQDQFPFILAAAIIAISGLGTYTLVRLLNK